MQAVILAGGFGTRLGHLVKEIPKPMLPINGRPFLECLVLLLVRSGIRDFVICTGYLAEQIETHFGDGTAWNARIQYSVETTPLGTGGAIKKAASLLQETFLLINGDNYLPLDYSGFFRTFRDSGQFNGRPLNWDCSRPVGLLSCWKNNSARFRNNLNLSDDGRAVAAYDYRNSQGKTHIDCGVKMFSRELLRFFDDRETFSLEEAVMPELARERLLAAYPASQPPYDIGTPEELSRTRQELQKLLPALHARV